jgi:hypothetical protein
MIAYASRTGSRRNLAALRSANWRLLVSRADKWNTKGFEHWAAENGAWSDKLAKRDFDGPRFEEFLGWIALQPFPPKWIALPDIVVGGLDSLALSLAWLARLRAHDAFAGQALMLVVQDGVGPEDVAALIGPLLGIFVGGSTEWKLATMKQWAALARSRDALCHVGRVNTARRIRLCAAAGVDSFDGTSASRFAGTLWPLELARQQLDLEALIDRTAA